MNSVQSEIIADGELLCQGLCLHATTDCLNIFVSLNFNKYFDEWNFCQEIIEYLNIFENLSLTAAEYFFLFFFFYSESS